jgi:hypothetical protein
VIVPRQPFDRNLRGTGRGLVSDIMLRAFVVSRPTATRESS